MMSDEGSQSIYVDRFWGQMLRKYLWATQGRPKLYFGSFSFNGEPNRPLSLIQPSGAIEAIGPILDLFCPHHGDPREGRGDAATFNFVLTMGTLEKARVM